MCALPVVFFLMSALTTKVNLRLDVLELIDDAPNISHCSLLLAPHLETLVSTICRNLRMGLLQMDKVFAHIVLPHARNRLHLSLARKTEVTIIAWRVDQKRTQIASSARRVMRMRG